MVLTRTSFFFFYLPLVCWHLHPLSPLFLLHHPIVTNNVQQDDGVKAHSYFPSFCPFYVFYTHPFSFDAGLMLSVVAMMLLPERTRVFYSIAFHFLCTRESMWLHFSGTYDQADDIILWTNVCMHITYSSVTHIHSIFLPMVYCTLRTI